MRKEIRCEIRPAGDCALVLRVDPGPGEPAACLSQAARLLGSEPAEGITDIVPSYAAVTVYFDPLIVAPDMVRERLERAVSQALEISGEPANVKEIPVCYGGVHGPDLQAVADRCGLTARQVAQMHAEAEYRVQMIGFTPGFPYLSGLPEAIAAPRRAMPRAAVAAGSVGIAGMQTGVYPVDSPGGWQIIGRTPLVLFDPRNEPPGLLKAGDRIRFLPISGERFAEMKGRPS